MPSARLERATCCLGGSRSVHLSYEGECTSAGRSAAQEFAPFLRERRNPTVFPPVSDHRKAAFFQDPNGER